MLSHLIALAWIQTARCLLGLGIGAFLMIQSMNIPANRIPRMEAGDTTWFMAGGIAFASLGVLRGVQGVMTMVLLGSARRDGGRGGAAAKTAVRRLGIILSVVDLVDLTAFPFTTAMGTYGLLVYRHPDIIDFFEGVFSKAPAEAGRPEAA